MAAIRSTGNKTTELRLASIFREEGIIGWRHGQRLPGMPDFLFRRERVAVFVDGCFWHGCRWHCRMPKSRGQYWVPKIVRNRERDLKVGKELRRAGWQVCRIWEHSLKKPAQVAARVRAILGNGPKIRLNARSNASIATHRAKIRGDSRHTLREDHGRVPGRSNFRKLKSFRGAGA